MERTQLQGTSLPKPKDLKLSLLSKTMSPKTTESLIYSPVTDLAMGLGELSTSGYGNTPKRRLSLSDGTPTPTLKPIVLEKQLSADAGYEEGYSPDDSSPFLYSGFGDILNVPSSPCTLEKSKRGTKSMFQSTALRRFQSLPVPFCDFEDAATPEVCHTKSKLNLSTSPTHHHRSPAKTSLKFGEDDETSQDSGFCIDSESLSESCMKVQACDFRFAEPLGRPPARRISRVLSDETNNPLFSPTKSPSPAKRPFCLFRDSTSPAGSPVKLQRSSLTSSDDDDDGFLELADVDDIGSTADAPKSMSGLFTNRMVLGSDDEGTPLRRRAFSVDASADQENLLPLAACSGSGSKRGLFRSPSCSRAMQRKSATFCAQASPLCPNSRQSAFKRSEPDSGVTPVQTKRRKSIMDESPVTNSASSLMAASPLSSASPSARTLQRCHSVALIESAMLRRDDDPNLVGDYSRSYTLPLCKSKHQDLKGISPDTMAALLRGDYADKVDRAIIVDARYPYEFNGGHLQGAENLWTKESIIEKFLTPESLAAASEPGKKTIIIFHCEFSSERGPRLCRFLRNKDRDANRDNYPALNYPELYLLEGGYKAFFYSQDQNLCEPNTYLPMLHVDHADDLRHFRTKSKSWAGEKPGRKSRVPFRPGLKL